MNAAAAASRLVTAWAVRYTRELPFGVAADRRAELASDLHEQWAGGRELGRPALVVASAILLRALGGIADDRVWRHQQMAAARRRMLAWDGERAVEVETPPEYRGLRGWVRTTRCLACDTRFPSRLEHCAVCGTR